MKKAESIQHAGREAARSPWVERAARLGYLVRGLLYVVMGFLAFQVAQGGDREADQQGALRLLAATPLGSGLLVVAAVGLAGYGVWGVVRAVLDPLGKGTDAKGLAQRAAYLVSGLAHGALCVAAVRLLTHTGGEEGGSSDVAATSTAWLLGQPFGAWLVGAAGLWMIGAGLGELYLAYSKDFRKDLRREAMGARELGAATFAGRAGMTARGVVFGLIGAFLVQAALNADANRARGVDGALESLAAAPHGPALLGLTAAGLAAYGVYSALCARWMRIPSS